MEIRDSWSKESECGDAKLPEQPPYPLPASHPAAFLVPDGEKRMSIFPKTVPCGNFALTVFVGWRKCLGRGPQEVADHNLGLPMWVGN